MDTRDTIALIEQGEGQEIEFMSQLSDRSLAETMVAFGNTNRGYIFVGVNKDGSKRSITDPEATRNTISNIARDRIDPPLSPEICQVETGGKIIFLITVPKSPPHSTNGCFFVRSGATNRRASIAEVRNMFEGDKVKRESLLMDALASDPILKRVLDSFPSETDKGVGYGQIEKRSGVHGHDLDEALETLVGLEAIRAVKPKKVPVIGDQVLYRRISAQEDP